MLWSSVRHRITPLKLCIVFTFTMRGEHSRSSAPQSPTQSCRCILPLNADAQACQTPTSPEAADAVMTDEKAKTTLSLSSAPLQSRPLCHSPMGDKEAEANPLEEAGDCLSNRPASSSSRPVNNEMLEENGEDCSAMPLQGVDSQDDSSPSHSSESPIKRRPGLKASAGRGQSKKLRQSADQASQPPRQHPGTWSTAGHA